MADFIRPKQRTFEDDISLVAKSIRKPRVETLSVKSEQVDIMSEPLDVVAINPEPLD